MAGAVSPQTVTHGFGLNDSRWIHGLLYAKDNPIVIENCSRRMDTGWYAVSLTLNSYTAVADEIAFRKEFPGYRGPLFYKTGRALGLVKVGYALPQEACEGHRWSSDQHAVANIITETLLFDSVGPPVCANFGTYPLKGAQAAVRKCAKAGVAANLRRHTHAQDTLPEQPGVAVSSGRQAAKTKKASEATESIRFYLRQHTSQNGEQVSEKPEAGSQTGALAKRAQKAVDAFRSSPSLAKRAQKAVDAFRSSPSLRARS